VVPSGEELANGESLQVQSFFDWFSQNIGASKPWLILGKGPTFSLRTSADLSAYHLLSLNHAVREQPVLVAHVIDIDVIQACGDALERNARVLVMPWYPHTQNFAGQRTLDELAEDIPLLKRLRGEGRLLWYDLSTSAIRHGPGPVIQATYFSAEAALNLLASAGVRQVRSLGVDGGSAYSGAFEDLRGSTLLANGRTSFDLQFAGFARTILRTGIDFAPLDIPNPSRVYVACSAEEALPAAVLQHSIRRHCSLTVEQRTLPLDRAPVVAGPAVLLPPRAQVLADLRPLWRAGVEPLDVLVPQHEQNSAGLGIAVVGSGLASSIPALAALIRLRAPFDALAKATEGKVRPALAADWNPDGAGAPDYEALALYYPEDGSEPWISRGHPLGHLWLRDLLDAVARGLVAPGTVAEEVRRGHVRPSLLYQVEHGLEEPLLLPRRARILDREFHPVSSNRRTSLTRHWAGVSRAVGRELRRRLRLLRARAAGRSAESVASPLVPRP
jgi:hypothetical protein